MKRDRTLHFITKEQYTCTKIKQRQLFPDVSGGQSDGALSRRNSDKILASIRCFPLSMCIIRRAPASGALRATRLPLTLSTCVQFKCTTRIVLDSFVYIFILWDVNVAASVKLFTLKIVYNARQIFKHITNNNIQGISSCHGYWVQIMCPSLPSRLLLCLTKWVKFYRFLAGTLSQFLMWPQMFEITDSSQFYNFSFS